MATPLLWPLIATQALWVAARATRLPEAAGPRQGQAGQGAPLRLLILGDSSAAGVGVVHQEQALAGRLVARLSCSHAVHWHLWARSGLTTSGALRWLCAHQQQGFDVAVLALGVNDVKNAMHITRWKANYPRLIQTLKTRFGVEHIYASGVPPLGDFPLLPQPLAAVLGTRASAFDTALAEICAHDRQSHHIPFNAPFDPALVASDGFHPSAELYDRWADELAARIMSQGAP